MLINGTKFNPCKYDPKAVNLIALKSSLFRDREFIKVFELLL